MKRFTLPAIAIALLSLMFSCGGSISGEPATAEGFANIETALNDKFGENASYTQISILHDNSYGNMMTVTVTDDPESMKMGEWNQTQGTWTQTSEVFLEVPEGTKAADFMFQLDDAINLSTLGKLVEQSKETLSKDKPIENPHMAMATIKYPDNGDRNKMKYMVDLEPENGGTNFYYYYTLSGELDSKSY